MRIEEFDYHLPTHLIAQYPAVRREESRLMVLHRGSGKIEHRRFMEVVDYFQPGDSLVVNNTKVIPARIYGMKETGGKVEVLLLNPVDRDGKPIPPIFNGRILDLPMWRCLIRDSRGIRPGAMMEFPEGLRGKIFASDRKGVYLIHFSDGNGILNTLQQIGEAPLPPYIKRGGKEREESFHRRRYQTVFARRSGSIAAPTAGLHFSRPLIRSIRDKGIEIHSITLQVGMGTFLPVRVGDIEAHRMEMEYMEISNLVAVALNRVRGRGNRICAVGTTTVRAIETSVSPEGRINPRKGYTELFIYPGHSFRGIDAMITNFHLPRSTLLMLVCAFAGVENVRRAYKEAIKEGYRFYSYGDAMLIL